MACIDINNPDLKEIQKTITNPLEAELQYDEVMSIRDEVNYKVYDFLKGLGVRTLELDDLSKITGYSITSASDLITKTILLHNEHSDRAFTKEAVYMILELLGRKNILRKDLIASIHLMDGYEEAQSKYKTSKLSDYGKRELIAQDYLRKALIDEYKSPSKKKAPRASKDASLKNKTGIKSKLERAILRIKAWWSRMVRKFFKSYKKRQTEDLINQIANDILNKNYRLFATGKHEYVRNWDEKGAVDQQLKKQVLDPDEVLARDKTMQYAFNTLKEAGFIPSGSYALAKQGVIYRDQFKDLDFQVPAELAKDGKFIDLIKEAFPLEQVIFGKAYGGVYGHRAQTMTINLLKKEAEGEDKGYEGLNVDFFIVHDPAFETYVTEDGVQDWYSIFDAKIRIGSVKHLNDLLNFVPYQSDINFRKGLRHFNFDFIYSKYNYDYKDDSTRLYDEDEVDVLTVDPSKKYSPTLVKKASQWLHENDIMAVDGKVILPNGQPSKQYQALKKFHKENEDNAMVDYWKTFSEDFKGWFGEIPGRAHLPKFSFGKIQKYNKLSWFIDSNSEPLVMYHGAGTIFDSFSKDYFLSGEGFMAYGAGFYNTSAEKTADQYAENAKAAQQKLTELIWKKDAALMEILDKYNKKIEDLKGYIIQPLQAYSNAGDDEGETLDTSILDLLGFIETKNLYISMSNPLFLDNKVRESIKTTVEKAFNVDLTRFGGSEMDLYRHLAKTLKISAPELSAKLYQIGIDGGIHYTNGGKAVAGFQHEKGEVHAIVYEPVQLKSVNNSGYYSTENANMYDPVNPLVRRGINALDMSKTSLSLQSAEDYFAASKDFSPRESQTNNNGMNFNIFPCI